jgi:hypothetical protein
MPPLPPRQHFFFVPGTKSWNKICNLFSVFYGEQVCLSAQKMDFAMVGLCLASAAIAAGAGTPPGTCFAVALCVVLNSAMLLVTRGVAGARAGL